MKLLWIINVGSDVIEQLLIRFSCIRQILEKKREYSETVHQLFIDFKKIYDSVKREVLYRNLIVWGTHETSQVETLL
jgi:hypothetical protein